MQDIEQRLIALSNMKRSARQLQRLLIGHATDIDLDSSGRVLLPPSLREFAGFARGPFRDDPGARSARHGSSRMYLAARPSDLRSVRRVGA